MSDDAKQPVPHSLFLGASDTLATAKTVPLLRGGALSIQAIIEGATAGSSPTDSPAGSWQLWSSGDGTEFSQVTGATVDTELAKIAPNTNTRVSAWAVFDRVPGTCAKLLYVRTGGGSAARCRLNFVAG